MSINPSFKLNKDYYYCYIIIIYILKIQKFNYSDNLALNNLAKKLQN
jgi:hypothetical protein